MNKRLEIKIAITDEDYAHAMRVRDLVFVQEQGIPKQKEFDGNDHMATHVLALDNGKPIGTMRIRYFASFVKFERMCVLEPYRKSDVAEQIMQKGMLFCAEKGYEKVYGVCKKELLARWKKDGFEPIPNVAPTVQNAMILVPVCCNLPKVKNMINMQTPPEIINAREGEWFTSPVKKELNKVKKMLQNRELTPAEKINKAAVTYLHKPLSTARED